MQDARPAVFLELLGTVGFEAIRFEGPRLDRFHVRPHLRGVLEELAPHARVGVIASDPEIDRVQLQRALAESKLEPLLFPGLIVTGAALDARMGAALAAADLTANPARAIYVGLDATLRLHAVDRGWRAAPHPSLVRALLANDSLVFVRLDGSPASWRAALVGRPVVPLLEARAPDAALYAVAARSAIDGLRAIRDAVTVLPGDPAVASLTLESVDAPSAAFVDRLRDDDRVEFAIEEAGDLFLAVRGNVLPGELHPPSARHGHTRVGHPDPLLLEPVATTGPLAGRALTPSEKGLFGQLDAVGYEQVLTSVLAASPGPSRNIGHAGNPAAVTWLSQALHAICGNAQMRPFPFNGGTLRNVEAEIPGTSAELVIVGAHLDSTAIFSTGYHTREADRPAPGADDDASGIAAVLSAAALLRTLANQTPPARTLRFVLFNAEEYGRGGSQNYADALKATGAPVVAMIQADMIGWRDPDSAARRFEIHGTGTANYADLVGATAQLTALVRDAAQQVSGTLEPQLYPLPGADSDPATHRSDHASFLSRGWPACLVSEDFFSEASGSPQDAGNPHYHTENDTPASLDFAYAADVARVVAASAWILATPTIPPPASIGPPRSGEPPVVTEPIRRSPPVSNPGPVPTKYVVEFLAKWIRDESFRCSVLHREIDAMEQYGLNALQITALADLETDKVLDRIRLEMTHFLGIDLERLHSEVGGPIPVEPTPATTAPAPGPLGPSVSGRVALRPMMMAEQSHYGQGNVHLRRAHPVGWKQGQEVLVSVLGQGFDSTPKVCFEIEAGTPPTKRTVDGVVLDIHCGVDVYQKVTVKVKLDEPGQWSVRGRNDVAGEMWSTETVIVTIEP